MQRRRKKKTAAKKANALLDKSLPSLPPSLSQQVPPARETEKSKTYPDVSSPDASSRNRSTDRRAPSSRGLESSPARQRDTQADNLILPSSTYRSNRHSVISNKSDVDAGEEFLIPLAFDPTADERPPSRGVSQDRNPLAQQYLDDTRSGASSRQASLDRQEGPSHISPPHIAYQEKGRQPGNMDPSRWRQSQAKSDGTDGFKLQDAPKGRNLSSSQSSKSDVPGVKESASVSATSSPNVGATSHSDPSKMVQTTSQKLAAVTGATSASRPSYELHRLHENESTDSARSYSSAQFPPKRGDSLERPGEIKVQRKEVGSGAKSASSSNDGSKDKSAPASTGKGADSTLASDVTVPSVSQVDGNSERSKDIFPDSLRAGHSGQHGRNGSQGALHSEPQRPADMGSPSLLRYSAAGEFSMEEDMARIWGADGAGGAKETAESFLKRVSNSVRHGRSYSDKGSRLSRDAKWPKSPVNGSHDITSPSVSSPEQHEDISWLRSELRRERQRVIERDQKITELETALNAVAEVKQANSELREKRSTIVVLDARKEIVLRELQVLTEHLEAEKRGGAPMDLNKLTSSVLRGFAESLQQLKNSFAPQIEELMQKRHELVEEVGNLSRMKDKSFQEFAQLSSKNAQLAELNNQLVHQIQELYKANSAQTEAARPSNGLGIYSHNKEKSTGSVEAIKASTHDLATSISTLTIQQDEAEPATVLTGPQVVSIRKGQPRKFNWKRGGQNVAKGVTKGLKGAFSAGDSKESVPHSSTTLSQDNVSAMPRSQTQDPSRQGFGFFGNPKKQGAWKTQQNGSSPALAETASSGPADSMLTPVIVNFYVY
jgi:hypothetical protein